MNATDTQQGIKWTLEEGPDALGHIRIHAVFVGVNNVPLESWQVPLDVYREAYAQLNPHAELAHRVVVARALLHNLDVPEDVKRSHDLRLLRERKEVEQRLHGKIPNKSCALCAPTGDIEE